MKTYLFAIIAILLFSRAFDAQTPTPTPAHGLTKTDLENLDSFTVNVKSAEILCEDDLYILKIVFDQTLKEIFRVSTIIENTGFDNRFNDSNSYHLINLTMGNRLDIAPMTVELNVVKFAINDAKPFEKSKKFSLLMRGLKLVKKSPTENASMMNVEVSPSCDVLPQNFAEAAKITDKSPPAIYDYVKEKFIKNTTKPEVKVGFAMNGERVTSPFYETSIAAEPFELKRLGLRGAYSIVPVFVAWEKNDTPGSEIDKLNFGTKFKHLFVFSDDGQYATNEIKTSPLMGIKSEITAKMETTSKFKSGNIILGLKTGLPVNLFQTRSNSMRLTPFAGFDFGYRILNAGSTNKEKWIMRPSFGAEFYYTPFRNETEIPVLIEMSYIRRVFLRPEEIYTRDAGRKPIIEGLTTNSKDFFSLQLTFWQTKFISPFIKYTYGRDAPRYLLENHKYRVGVQANFDWGDKK